MSPFFSITSLLLILQTVYSAFCRGEAVAVKVLAEHEWDDEAFQAFLREADIMSRIRHKNVGTNAGITRVS